MLVGYARTSTLDQVAGLAGQQRDLAAAGCERVFVEQVSSVDTAQRGALADALAFCRAGDTLVVTRLDRLARSVAHLMDIVKSLDVKGVALRILGMDIDTATPTGKLMLAILGGVAEFEREIMLERQREGIAKAKAAGKYRGRKPTARAKAADILRLQREGLGAADIARQLRIGRASVYRILSDRAAGGANSSAP
ncbi:recombinase family protein [Paracoccus pantotrophus]|uniref:recombinase family protein n=1 Tax=Paracoccus pantotrophus TaxID=82367 RepID=UPI00048FBCEE|nr:recombinase family protein [Paracoccus pantotrophus]RNI13904.1 recombinase family protein [Paracoccus pantotrophus]RNI16417.1 recombinase family protein [Paracoccus pantotrophus]